MPRGKSLLDDLERRSLIVTIRGTRQERSESMNRLAIPADDTTYIALPHREPKVKGSADWSLVNDQLVRKFHELPQNKF